jgi:peptidoglycan-associated lipoprotein
MKKVLFLMVVLVSVVSLVGCHPKKRSPVVPGQETQAPSEKVVKQEPAEKPSDKPIKPIEPGEGEDGVLKDIHFEYDKYNLTDEAADLMGRNAEYLMTHPEVRILIEGHCDERGTEEYNLALGEKRALAARDYFVRFGIDRDKMSIISYGEERPLDAAGDEQGWAKNRRDHFVVK